MSSKLDPVLPEADSLDLLTTCLESVLSLLSDGVKKGKPDSYQQQVVQDQLLASTLKSLNGMLQELLAKDFSPDGFYSIVRVGDSIVGMRDTVMRVWDPIVGMRDIVVRAWNPILRMGDSIVRTMDY